MRCGVAHLQRCHILRGPGGQRARARAAFQIRAEIVDGRGQREPVEGDFVFHCSGRHRCIQRKIYCDDGIGSGDWTYRIHIEIRDVADRVGG